MILVTGAAGKTGRAVIRELARGREPVRAFAHRPGQAASLREVGAQQVLVGDMLDPAAVGRAFDEVRAVYHIGPNVSPQEVRLGEIALASARAAGVERFVFHSVLHPHVEAMPHHWKKARVEELLFASGLGFVILQPTVYMQNVAAQWGIILKEGRYPVPYAPETRLSLVDLEDVARAAAVVLTDPGWIGSTIELVGTSALSPLDIVGTLSRELGRSVIAERVPLEAWERNARASGMGDYQVSALTAMFRYYEDHGLVGNSNALQGLLGREPTSFAAFVRRTMEERRP